MTKAHSPFPGMDPFLEESDEWRGAHTALTIAIRNLIWEYLPEQFAVRVEGNVKILDPDELDWYKPIKPDVFLTRTRPIRGEQFADAIITPPVEMAFFESHIEEKWLEVVDQNRREVVTTIEILSPHNKIGKGFDEFAQKRALIMASDSNWLEIDLLRRGKRMYGEIIGSHYHVLGKRASRYHRAIAF